MEQASKQESWSGMCVCVYLSENECEEQRGEARRGRHWQQHYF